jgi:hypothetical protein
MEIDKIFKPCTEGIRNTEATSVKIHYPRHRSFWDSWIEPFGTQLNCGTNQTDTHHGRKEKYSRKYVGDFIPYIPVIPVADTRFATLESKYTVKLPEGNISLTDCRTANIYPQGYHRLTCSVPDFVRISGILGIPPRIK